MRIVITLDCADERLWLLSAMAARMAPRGVDVRLGARAGAERVERELVRAALAEVDLPLPSDPTVDAGDGSEVQRGDVTIFVGAVSDEGKGAGEHWVIAPPAPQLADVRRAREELRARLRALFQRRSDLPLDVEAGAWQRRLPGDPDIE